MTDTKIDLANFTPDTEVEHICEYLRNTWNTPSSDILEKIVRTAFMEGWEIAKTRIDHCDALYDLVENLQNKYNPNAVSANQTMLLTLATAIFMTTMRLNKEAKTPNLNFTERTSAIISKLTETYGKDPLLILEPTSYTELKDKDIDDLAQRTAGGDAYKGQLLETATGSTLPERLALYTVAYNENEQGYSPLHTLIGTIYAQGILLREYYNARELEYGLSDLRIDNNNVYINDNETTRTILRLTLARNAQCAHLIPVFNEPLTIGNCFGV